MSKIYICEKTDCKLARAIASNKIEGYELKEGEIFVCQCGLSRKECEAKEKKFGSSISITWKIIIPIAVALLAGIITWLVLDTSTPPCTDCPPPKVEKDTTITPILCKDLAEWQATDLRQAMQYLDQHVAELMKYDDAYYKDKNLANDCTLQIIKAQLDFIRKKIAKGISTEDNIKLSEVIDPLEVELIRLKKNDLDEDISAVRLLKLQNVKAAPSSAPTNSSKGNNSD